MHRAPDLLGDVDRVAGGEDAGLDPVDDVRDQGLERRPGVLLDLGSSPRRLVRDPLTKMTL